MRRNVFVLICMAILCTDISFAIETVDVSDLIFNIGGRKEKAVEYKFASGDTIIINASVMDGDDISEITVMQWPYSVKFQAIEVEKIENKKIFVQEIAVYLFTLRNSATFKSKTYQLNIKRIPGSDDMIMFNTSVEWDTLYDTTYIAAIETVLVSVDTTTEEIIKTEAKLGSKLSGNTRSYIQIDLPEGTQYWVYWIGVGQKASEGLQSMAEALPAAAVALGIVNPVIAFATGFIPGLFMMNKGDDIYYCFIADFYNLQNFLQDNRYYLIKGGKVITDYGKMQQPAKGRFYLGLDNSYSVMTSKTITVNVVAVTTKARYEYHDVQKPVINERVVPKLD